MRSIRSAGGVSRADRGRLRHPEFNENWWHASYWKSLGRRRPDLQRARLRRLRRRRGPRVPQVAEPRDFIARGRRRGSNNEINAIHELVRERDRAQDRLAHLDEIYLDAGAELPRRAPRERRPRATRAVGRERTRGPRRAAWAAAGRRRPTRSASLLGDIANTGLPQMITQLDERRLKASAKMTKFLRPKHRVLVLRRHDRFRPTPAARRRHSRPSKSTSWSAGSTSSWQARPLRVGSTCATTPQLWWLVLHDSPPNRCYAPHLWDYYQRRPRNVS